MPPLLNRYSEPDGAGHLVALRSSDFEHVQVRMPWHFPEGRRVRLVRR